MPYEIHSLPPTTSLLSLFSYVHRTCPSRGTNTETHVRCRLGVPIPSTTATARSAYDSPGAPSGGRPGNGGLGAEPVLAPSRPQPRPLDAARAWSETRLPHPLAARRSDPDDTP